MNIYQSPSIEEIQHLLELNELPTKDLSELSLDHFYACGARGEPKGVIGLQVYGTEGLLRSFAVSQDSQGNGYGAALLGVDRGFGSDRQRLSPAAALLRTVHASFPAHGSSLCESHMHDPADGGVK